MKIEPNSKMWIAIIIVVCVGSLFNYWTTLIIYEHFYVEQTGQQLEEKGKRIAEQYHGGEINQDLKDMVQSLNEISNEEIIIADDPEVLGECIPVEHEDTSPFSEQQIEDLYNGKTAIITGEHTTCKKDIIAVAVPLIDETDNNKFIGAIFVYMPLATVKEAVSEVKLMLIVYILVFLILGIIAGKVITSKVTKPLKQMESVAQKMLKGDFNAKVDVITDDIIGRLGKTFNHLSYSLDETIKLLSKEKKQLSQILDGIRDGVITIDINGELILCNCSTINLLNKIGLSKEQFLALEEIQGYIKKSIEEKEIFIKEIEYKESIFVLNLAPLIEDNRLWATVLVIHDVTEERQREKEAREFLAIVSHELRTPLSYMKGYTEALIDGVAEDSKTKDRYLNTIYKETERMERLVNDLLDLAQLEKETYKIGTDKLLLNKVVQQIVERYKGIYDRKGVLLSYNNKDNTELWINGDEDRIIQILVNLLDNALRYTHENGSVSVKTFTIEDKVVLEITDTGEGIENRYLDKIGTKFFRVDKARSRKNGGIGLGLAIVEQIVERLDGRLKVESEVGKGTTFTIYLPSHKG